MKTTTNTIHDKKSFKIALFKDCPIWGKLKFDKEQKGYLKYFDADGEITEKFDSYNPLIRQSILTQAELICTMKGCILWSY